MKKLMFAAAALTAGIAMADIVSSDIVGYAQNNLKSGYTMIAPQFIDIATATMDIQQLKATGDSTGDNVVIQTLDQGGYTVNSYAWNDWAAAEPCWVDDDYVPVEGITFEPGAGLWVQGLNTDQGIQSAGKVGTSDVVVTLRNGFTAAGNPFPVAIDLQDIVAEGDNVADNVVIQTLDQGGYTLKSYAWNDWAAAEPCWVDDDYNPVEDVVFAPGAGLWVQGISGDQSIRFPAPEL